MGTGPSPYAQRVYDWERTFVEPADGTFLSRDACVALAADAARVLAIPAPSLRFQKASRAPCRANASEWTVSISDWGRTRVTVLHEMAHLGAAARGALREDPHGPTFLRCAIDLYAVLAGIPAAVSEAGAARFGLRPAPAAAAPPRLAAPSTFFDGDF